jgi:hypothetical protein
VPNRTASTLLSLLLVIVAVGCGTADEDKVGLIGDSITDLSREPLTQALGEEDLAASGWRPGKGFIAPPAQPDRNFARP